MVDAKALYEKFHDPKSGIVEDGDWVESNADDLRCVVVDGHIDFEALAAFINSLKEEDHG